MKTCLSAIIIHTKNKLNLNMKIIRMKTEMENKNQCRRNKVTRKNCGTNKTKFES